MLQSEEIVITDFSSHVHVYVCGVHVCVDVHLCIGVHMHVSMNACVSSKLASGIFLDHSPLYLLRQNLLLNL